MPELRVLFDKIEQRAIKKRQWICIPRTNVYYFHIDLMVYKGKDLILVDGTKITKGNMVGEMHVNNNNMPEITFKNLKTFTKSIDEELYLLAQALGEDAFKSVHAFFGRTLLYPFVEKKGFEVREIQSLRLRVFLNIWDTLIRKVYAKNPNKNIKKRRSKEIWISRGTLLKKLGEVSYEKENNRH